METRYGWHWEVAADDGCLREDEHQTVEFLRQLQATLEQLVPQEPPYTRLNPQAIRQSKPRRLIALVAAESQTLHSLRTKISELENLLSKRYDPLELGQYGTINLHLGRRSFCRGFLDKRQSVPLLRRSSPEVARFLQKVPKFGDYLKRENHSHFGFHYHYLSRWKERSDTVLCFKPANPWPLFAEKHAEKSAHFPARPRAWSEDRRSAIYDVLGSEKSKFKADEFRHPSNGSNLVWRDGAVSIRKTKKNGLELVLTTGMAVALD